MARDYEDVHDTENLGDDELRELVRSHLAQNDSLDADDITVHVESGQVRLIGRVGTEGEARIAEHIVTDVLGLMEVSNELVVDALRRAESSESGIGADRAFAGEDEVEGVLRGDRAVPFSSEGADLDGGTWSLPESPTPEGTEGGAER